MIWLKRLSVLLVLVVAVGAFLGYRYMNRQRFIEAGQKNALVTAQAWVATATYRNNPERYAEFRDSLLTASGITVDELQDYLNRYQAEPEKYYYFAKMVKYYVDSITAPLVESTRDNTDSLEAAAQREP